MLRAKLQRTRYVWNRVSDSFGYYSPPRSEVRDDLILSVRRSLAARPRHILPKYLYDAQGSRLFGEICGLPEYYQTRTESAILGIIRYELARYLRDQLRLVELGSGAPVKIRHVLDAVREAGLRLDYVPIDISISLVEHAQSLARRYRDLTITGIIDTYENGLNFLSGMSGPPNLIAFFGSSLGNMSPDQSYELVGAMRRAMRPRDMFLVGLDMVKDSAVLEAAYNDSAGLTARFNLNLLERLNRELGADFDADAFSHYAVYNKNLRRIEMYLRSEKDQTVEIPRADIRLNLDRGELIHTENSYKYTINDIRTLAERCGFSIERIWRDDDELFSVTLMSAGNPPK